MCLVLGNRRSVEFETFVGVVARWMQWNGFERGLGYTMKLDILLFISCGRSIISQRLPSLKSRIQILYGVL